VLTLALDTSTSTGSLALSRGQDILFEYNWRRQKSHSETVTAEIENALEKLNLKAKDVELFAVGTGPGSFTGIRVAVNIAKTFSYSLDIPLVAIDSLEILAGAAFSQKNCRFWRW
jgi:tRNA threonylcarbamoyladenosine biosynthesis protein TsaB